MAQAARLNLRMQKELKLLLTDPPPSASFPTLSDDTSATSLTSIDALLQGPEGTVYDNGVFKIKIQIPERYPFQPPIVTFATPIYHPNIDNGGRICLDILNLPPKGMWQPSLNISTVLTSIGLLLSEPNPDDGLMHEASRDYKYNRQAFDQNARSLTEKHARAGEPQSARGSHETHTGQNTEKEFIAGLAQTKLEGSGVSMPGVSVSMSMPTTEHRKLSLGSSSNQMYKVLSHDYSKKDTPLKEANDVCTGKLQAPRNNKLSLKVSVRNEGSSGQNHLIIDEKENFAPVQCGAPQLTNQTCTKQQQQINRDCSTEAVIVLDSEDSEDEIVPVRSKLSLAKRCCLSRKRKSAH